jgi:formate hydrogenlyase subunit 6/NADH:ubiquinone oxidoreductase subunit I
MSDVSREEELAPPSYSSGLVQDLLGAFQSFRLGLRSVQRALGSTLPYLRGGSAADLRKEVTEQYPDPVSSRTEGDLPPRSRGLLFNDIERCTGCRDCEKTCPVRCISIETVQVPDSAKAWVSVFDIDFSSCTFCGLCVEACVPASLVHTRAYERAVFDLPDMAARFGRGRITPEQRARWERVQRETQGSPVFSLADFIQGNGTGKQERQEN